MPIRLATSDDLSMVMEILNLTTLDLLEKGIYQWEHPWDEALVLEQINRQELHLVRFKQRDVAAFVLSPAQIEPDSWYFKQFAILPEFQRQFLGSMVMYLVRGMHDLLYLDCYAGAEGLKQFYRSCGFEEVGDFPENDYEITRFKSDTRLPVLETDRLMLRKIQPADSPDMFEYLSDPEVMKFIDWDLQKNISQTEFLIKEMRSPEIKMWAILEPGSGKMIGNISLCEGQGTGHAELGFNLARSYWNQGLMTEAVNAILNFGFVEMGLEGITARTVPENKACAKLLEKVGMVYECRLMSDAWINGQAFDTLKYAIYREEYRKEVNG
ncbi:MAG: GNAT family N-acetyltransferase [Turicibacter sp.]|nr:GNAT family N-acetyltransferase [Turicibacter sp.]